jgi:hypothetical protein
MSYIFWSALTHMKRPERGFEIPPVSSRNEILASCFGLPARRRFRAEESAQTIQVEPLFGKFLLIPSIGCKRIVDDSATILIAIESATEDVAEFSSSTGGQPCLVHRATLFEGPLRGRFLRTELIKLTHSAAERGSPPARTGGFFCCAYVATPFAGSGRAHPAVMLKPELRWSGADSRHARVRI